MHNLVVETTRLGIEVKNLKMRLESMSSRLDFDERRARALEGVVQYGPARSAATAADGSSAGRTCIAAQPERRTRSRRRRRAGADAASASGPGDTPDVVDQSKTRGPARPSLSHRPGRGMGRTKRLGTSGSADRRPGGGKVGAPDDRAGDREARGRRPALRRRHQRRRGAARALHRRAARAARRGRGRDDLRARLRDVAERAAGRRRDHQRRPGAPISGRAASAIRTTSAGGRNASSTQPHSVADELAWLDSEGPASPALIDYIDHARPTLRLRHFSATATTTRSTASRRVPRKAILVPTAERDPAIGLSIFRPIFRGVRGAHVQLARRAGDDPGRRAQRRRARRRRRRRLRRAGEHRSPHGSARSTSLDGPFAIYVGRIDENKGCAELFDFFQRYAATLPRGSTGADRHAVMPIPDHPRIRHLGFLTDQDKFDAHGGGRAADHAVVFREPVDGGARGVGARPAGAGQRPLRRSEGPVHPQQRRPLLRDATRSSPRRCYALESNGPLHARSAGTAASTFERHYDWPVIERKYLDMFEQLAARPTATGRIEPMPGWLARAARRISPPARDRLAGVPCRRTSRRRPVTHERRLPDSAARASGPRHARLRRRDRPRGARHPARPARAGYDSEIFVETADPRLEDLTLDYREMVGEVAPEDLLIHHFSIGSRASRTAYALPGRMALVYHNITPPEYFLGVHKDLVKLCLPRTPRADGLHRRAPSSRSAIPNSTARSSRRSGFTRPACCPSFPDFAHLDGAPDRLLAGRLRRRVDQHHVRRPRHSEQEVRGRHPRFHAYRTRHNPRSRLLLVGSYSGFEKYLAMLQQLIARLGHARRALPRARVERGAHRAVRRRRSVPVRQRARGLLRADVEAFYKRVPVLAYAATAVPATMDGGGVLYDTKDAARGRGADGGDPRRPPASRTPSLASQDAALVRLRASRLRGHAAAIRRQVARLRRARRPRSPGTSGSSSISSSGSRSCASSGRRCIGRCRGSQCRRCATREPRMPECRSSRRS